MLHVDPHVPRDHVSARRRVRTLRTLVGFLAGVGAQVCVQVIAPTEHLATDVTLVRLETGVQAHVAREHVGARERAITNLAQVHLQQDTRIFTYLKSSFETMNISSCELVFRRHSMVYMLNSDE